MPIGGLRRQHVRLQRWPRALGVTLAVSSMLLLCGCKVDLYSKLQEREANLIVATLLRNGLPADRVEMKDGTSTVRVEETSFASAVTLLNAAGLPHAKFQTMAEIFPSESLVASPTEERARFIFALSQELSRTVSEIDGVISARVHVVLPKSEPLRPDQTPSSASVFIKHDRRMQAAALLPQIKTLVANSVEGLAYDKVSVVFVPASEDGLVASGVPVEPIAGADRGRVPMPDMRMVVISVGIGLAVFGAALLLWLWRRGSTHGPADSGVHFTDATHASRRPLRAAE
ncbi:type III secretion system inner membrane ring lipoprotein SctJ [Bradyrhizobium sp. USDA 4353]